MAIRKKPEVKTIASELCKFEILEIKSDIKETEYIFAFTIPSYLVPEDIRKRAKRK